MSDLDQDREPSDAVKPPFPAGANRDKLQRLLLSAFVHQQEQVRNRIDHTGRLAAVLSIQQEITSREPDLEEVLSLVSNRAITILGATGSAIALQRDGTMVCRASGGATGPALGAHLSAEFGLSGECLRTGQPVLCNDVDKDSRVDTAAAQALGIRSLIVAPVFHHRTTVGVFEVFSGEPDFFDKEDAHVVELLGGMITTAISYSSEFEAKQTLQSERSAMLEVIERITPTITRMLEQQSVAAVPVSTNAEEPEELGESLSDSDIKEEIAHSADVELDEELYSEAPALFADSESSNEDVSDELAPEQASADGNVDEQDQIGAPALESEPEESTAVATTPLISADDREKRAVDSAIEILLSNEQVLEPEPPESEESAPVDEADPTALFTPARRALPHVAPFQPVAAPIPPQDFDWPEPEAPRLPGSQAGDSLADGASDEESGSALDDWSPPALLQTRTPLSAPRGEGAGSLVPSAASTTEFFTLSHDLPPIPPTGAVKASKAVGAPSAPLGRSRGGMALTLRLRNILEYVVPAVLTGLLIVIGLQWLTSNQRIPSLLGGKGLKAPPPSMFSPTRRAPVEVSLLKIPGTSPMSRSGKEITDRVSAIVGFDRAGSSEDWSESAKQLGKKLTDRLPSVSTTPDNNERTSDAAMSQLERVLPSNAFGGAASHAVESAKSNVSGPVAQVHLPVEVIDDYVLVRVQPMYPQVARQNNITGMVVLNTLIGRDGSVRDVRAVSGNKYLAEAAMAAVSQWRYKPFVLNGKPIEVATEVRIAFTRKPGQQRVRQ